MWDIEEESRERSAKHRKSRSKKKASVSSIVEMLGGALPSAHGVESTTVSSQPLSPAHSRTSGMSGRERSPCERSPDRGTGRKRARSPESPRHGLDGSGECRAKVGLSDERRHWPRPSLSGLESSHRDRSGARLWGRRMVIMRQGWSVPALPGPVTWGVPLQLRVHCTMTIRDSKRIPYRMLPMLNGPRVFSCDQAAEWFRPDVCPSHLFDYADIGKTFIPLPDRRTGNHMENPSFTGPQILLQDQIFFNIKITM